MKILIASTPATGHINPLIGVARVFLDRGHEVVFQTANTFRNRIEQQGVPFRSFLPGADLDLRQVDTLFPDRKHLKPGPEMGRFDLKRIFIDPAPHQHESLLATLRDWPADAIIADDVFLGTVPMLLGDQNKRPTIIHWGTTCLFTERDDGGPANLGLPLANTVAQREEYSVIRAELDRELLVPVRRYFDTRLVEIGARPLPFGFLSVTAKLADLYLQPTIPSFEYPSQVLSSLHSFHFVGQLPQLSFDIPRPSWADDIDGKKRVVLVTQGTINNHDFGQLVAPTLSALADDPDLLVLVTSCGRPLDAIPGRIPDNARLSTLLPFDWLLPKIDVLVTNGGYGTVSQALKLGIPLVVAGMTEDKPEVAARVAWAGVGINLASNHPTPEALRDAVRSTLDAPQYRERAEALAREFACYDTKAAIIRLVTNAVERRRDAAMPSDLIVADKGRHLRVASSFDTPGR
jgi:MGT family glycosyltransferase